MPLKLNDHVNTASFDEDVVEKEIYAVVGYGVRADLKIIYNLKSNGIYLQLFFVIIITGGRRIRCAYKVSDSIFEGGMRNSHR